MSKKGVSPEPQATRLSSGIMSYKTAQSPASFSSFLSRVSGMLPEIEVLEGAGKGVKGNGVIGIIDV